jgi:hypothetical protein
MRSNRNPSGSVARSVGRAGADKPSGRELAAGELAAGELAPGELAPKELMDERTPESKTMLAKTMVAKAVVANLNMPHMPVEWLDSGNWRLPSGKALAEFALQAGFLAPLLLGAEGFGKTAMQSRNGVRVLGMGAARAKNCNKGAGR